MNFRSYHDISMTLWNGLHMIPKSYDLVVGIPRSGMIPCVMLAEYLHIPMASLDGFVNGNIMPFGGSRTSDRETSILDVNNVLVIDDSIYSGESMREAKSKISGSRILGSKNINIDYCAVYSTCLNEAEIDYCFEVVPIPRKFQWNIFNSPKYTGETCFDIDGVISRDPTEKENDDGKEYSKFLINADVKLPLRFKAGAFITARLEKYRELTLRWLHEHGYMCKELIMLGCNTKEERISLGCHASFKANVYKKRHETLFVESNWCQAQEISRISNKDVFCTENMKYISAH